MATIVNIPQHVAIIMDGNGRWAQRRGEARIEGHRVGAQNLEDMCRVVAEYDIPNFSVFAFGKNNWKRGKEAGLLMRLASEFFLKKGNAMIENNIRVSFIGDLSDERISRKLVSSMRSLEERSISCTGLNLQIAFNYSGRDEIIRAQALGLQIENLYDHFLDAVHVPPVDLVIRTGVQNAFAPVWRDSDFLPLSTANAVKVPCKTLWPEFGETEFGYALRVYGDEDHLNGSLRATASVAAE